MSVYLKIDTSGFRVLIVKNCINYKFIVNVVKIRSLHPLSHMYQAYKRLLTR